MFLIYVEKSSVVNYLALKMRMGMPVSYEWATVKFPLS